MYPDSNCLNPYLVPQLAFSAVESEYPKPIPDNLKMLSWILRFGLCDGGEYIILAGHASQQSQVPLQNFRSLLSLQAFCGRGRCCWEVTTHFAPAEAYRDDNEEHRQNNEIKSNVCDPGIDVHHLKTLSVVEKRKHVTPTSKQLKNNIDWKRLSKPPRNFIK